MVKLSSQDTGQPIDGRWEAMDGALVLAAQAIGRSDPNPRVGCVLTRADGEVIGQGSTQQAGGPHAEVMALRDAQARGASVAGATAYVTLEPCAHHGRTPPCADALIAAELARAGRRAGGGAHARCGGAGGRLASRPSPCREITRTQHRFPVPHGAQAPLGAAEGGGLAGWPHGAARWPQPMDHRRRGPGRRPRLARPGHRRPYGHRHGAGRQPSPRCTRHPRGPPALAGGAGFALAHPSQGCLDGRCARRCHGDRPGWCPMRRPRPAAQR